MEAFDSTTACPSLRLSSLVIDVGGAHDGLPSLVRSFEVKKADRNFVDFDDDGDDLALLGSFAKSPGAFWLETAGEAGRPLL
jgi:hypothetical protein